MSQVRRKRNKRSVFDHPELWRLCATLSHQINYGFPQPACLCWSAIALHRKSSNRLLLEPNSVCYESTARREQQLAKAKKITVAGKRYASRSDAAAALGVDYFLLSKRLGYGWTPEQAAGIDPPPSKVGNASKVIIIEGITYPSAEAAAEIYGIAPGTFRMRLQRGDSPERAAGVEARTRSSGAARAVLVAGKKYKSIKDACELHGVKPSVFSKRIDRGWTPEQAAGFEPPPNRTTKPGRIESIGGTDYPKADAGEYRLYLITNTVNDKEYIGITTNGLELRFRGHKSEACKPSPANPLHRAMKKYGSDKFKIKLLRNDALNFVELMEQEIQEIAMRDSLKNGYNASFGGEIPANAISVEVEGKIYPTLTSAANSYGVDPKVVQLRIQRLGWEIERALEIGHSLAEKTQVTAGGVPYSSLKQAAESLGKSYKTVHARVTRYGWTPEQALGLLPPPNEAKSVPRSITVNGIEFSSQAAAARHFGISPALVSKRVRKLGMSLEEALIKPKRK